MEISCGRLQNSLLNLKSLLQNEDKVLDGFLRLRTFAEKDVDKLFRYLTDKLLDVEYTEKIGICFADMILLLVSSAIRLNDQTEDFQTYQRKCIALSKLMNISQNIQKYATKYFTDKPAPFHVFDENNFTANKRSKLKESNISNMDIVKCCYYLLSSDGNFFKDLWNWSKFLALYLKKGNYMQQMYCNHICAIITNMTDLQLKHLNRDVPDDIQIRFNDEIHKISDLYTENYVAAGELGTNVKWNFQSDVVISIEGVLLPIFNKNNSKFYDKTDGNYDRIVRVESTQMNLRSIGLGVASGKAICLSGPVGCGKTTLVEYLARKTGRICPKNMELQTFEDTENGFTIQSPTKDNKFKKTTEKTSTKEIQKKRKLKDDRDDDEQNGLISFNFDMSNADGEKINGFLRIQLGDQTDSKMLLGQYRCTDVPGEFIWLPGVLTQAVMNGYWLLLEDLDSATQDTFTILSNLLENNYLSVPGFRDCVKIEPGFQLFVTTRTNKSTHNSQKSLISLLEKYLYTINVLPLSRDELCSIVSVNYPKLKTVAGRIVDVFLNFSSGDHTVENYRTEKNENDIKIQNGDMNGVPLPLEKLTLSNLVNSGRLVSTRDLMKLCQRSNPMFSVTSTECAYFVFENAVDVFCSYLPSGPEKTKLIVSIGAKLGIIQSRCEFLSNEYKPEVVVNQNSIKVGRAELTPKIELDMKRPTDTVDLLHGNKKIKINESTEKTVYVVAERKEKHVTFSFTRMTSCLLERIAVCVGQSEPILLVGETGVGKTSSVQYLAQKTRHKLIVVNMNNQSDVSDLVGGFKPVDLSYVMAPIRTEFEQLFRKTFNESKNEKFLTNVSICYNQGNFSILIKLIIKIVDSVFERANTNSLTVKNEQECLKKWRLLQTKIMKLDSQLKKSINISFAFIPGSLVNCIKNGDWVLLDEINLASAETLECLSTILEPDGSVVLLEKGDFTPVKRHPNFRIFACMNPNTDIGKKDLPVGIRNRFTEFFVDELTTENDLMLLVNDYLSNTGIKKTKVLNIVKLYQKLKILSRLELNDGLGNRPVFSLRTLCRSLMICAKNLCGSIERNLYESFCLSFLTQLDNVSHKIVLSLIKDAMLSNPKAILSQAIPKPGDNYLEFEGYWIEKGTQEINECENYILTEGVKENLKDLARIISIGKLPILLQGPTSAGKTSLIEYVAKKSGNHCLRINNHEHTDLQEYIGTYTSDVSGKLSFNEGVLVQAMRNGFWIILDELNLASTDILEALNRVLDDNRELFIPETQTVVKAHHNFMLFATQNPPGLYGGRKTLSRAFKNRFIELHFSEIPKVELEIILEKRCLIPKSYSQKMVKCMSELQANRKTTTRNNFTLRDLFRWGNRYTYADKKLLENNSYDWNQHLIDEGYLVLSAKVRTEIEVEIIEEALYKTFRKKINIENLYSLSENVSMVTKDILQSIHNYKKRSDIIWTQNMTRMAVLTAKAIQFNEPVLLVGPTGCGKTTLCQILASINGRSLRILNCHMHTEGADFLGGLRPCRTLTEDNEQNLNKSTTSRKQLFEWADGPLVKSMQDGNYFMADEISLAEDSVLERLNSILEPERTVLLAEKGGVTNSISKDFIIQAHADFNFLATMNPGGDFGKKELSPALRNRFTEIWCKPSDDREDLIQISANCFSNSLPSNNETDKQKIRLIAIVITNVVFFLKDNIEKFKFSVRDILAWSNYLLRNSNNPNLDLAEAIIFGLETIFLDSLEMLPHESIKNLTNQRNKIIEYAIMQMKTNLEIPINRNNLLAKSSNPVEFIGNVFGIKPFYINTGPNLKLDEEKSFLFEAPTTKTNLFRLLSALTLKKAVLLEGPPGVGKTSIVESLAKVIGYKIVRINLCEHTDLADLFGTDLPAEEKALEINAGDKTSTALKEKPDSTNLGSFVWRDGPLLAALKTENTWILLDELNLAPQSVLEGLNAILDHRGEVFIPELNKTFSLGKQTRIFACQNPLRQGGGRKGLPQSFLNRFTKVYLRKLTTDDLLFVVKGRYSTFFDDIKSNFIKYSKCIVANETDRRISTQQINNKCQRRNYGLILDLPDRMVRFSEILDQGISDLQFGYKGGPFEINLRDILRWCDLLNNKNTGFLMESDNDNMIYSIQKLETIFDNFLLILYERMKLVYYQRMRSDQDRSFIRDAFSKTFDCDAEILNNLSDDISFYWTDSAIYLNDIVLKRDQIGNITTRPFKNKNLAPLLFSSQRQLLKNLTECVHMEKPVILCGPTDSGKTKAIDLLCTLSNQNCNSDTIDDSVTGSFQQIDLNRHLEEISQNVEWILINAVQTLVLQCQSNPKNLTSVVELLNSWNYYTNLTKFKIDPHNASAMSEELIVFKKRTQYLNEIIEMLKHVDVCERSAEKLKNLEAVLDALKNVIHNSNTLNTGGHFEWVDSKIVKSLKSGDYICLEHVNLCSSAVLDRLNPVFEPAGNLLISEKGVTAGDEAELVEKHTNFRAFLTLDPKNGELSRAMRNRCIEISIPKDSYTVDDLKMLIYVNGVHEMHLIDVIFNIHEKIKTISELNTFNVSHLTQFAFLVSSYKRIGYPDEKAISVSGLEVYVYSSNTDLLGYGLAFYRNKLRDVIIDGSTNLLKNYQGNFYSLKNVVLSCENLNSMALVKLQCEPLRVLLDANEMSEESVCRLFNDLQNIKYENNVQFLKSYVFLIYEASTFADFSFRHKHLNQIIADAKKLNETDRNNLFRLNNTLMKTIENAEHKFRNCALDLPWNSKLFARIRDYKINTEIKSENELQMSALLLSDLIIEIVEQENICKLQKITALTYSQKVYSKMINDSVNISFLKYLSPFLESFKAMVTSTLQLIELDMTNYGDLIVAFLWFNRLHMLSKTTRLFVDNALNTDLVDKMILHFKWLDKNLLQFLIKLVPNYRELNRDFDFSLQKLTNYVSSKKHPLNLIRKFYLKHLTKYDPFYSNEQTQLCDLKKSFDEIINIVPHFGSFEMGTILKKYVIIFSEDADKLKEMILNKRISQTLRKLQKTESDFEMPQSIPDELQHAIVEFNKIRSVHIKNDQIDDEMVDLEDLEKCLTKCKEINEQNPEEILKNAPNFVEIQMLSLKEYFLIKYLNWNEFHVNHLNSEYYENICSLKYNDLELLRIINTNEYRDFQKMWQTTMKCIVNSENLSQFEDILQSQSSLDYRNFSTFYRSIMNSIQLYNMSSLANRRDCCLELSIEKDEITSEIEYNGPPLTSILISLLFQNDGHFRPIALSNINLWKNSLNNIRQLLWNNSELMLKKFNSTNSNLQCSLVYSQKLIFEIQYIQKVCAQIENPNDSDYNQQFQKLVDKLRIVRYEAKNCLQNHSNDFVRMQKTQIYTGLMNSLIGSIELCILTFTPLIDPVERNRLKNSYIEEDLNCLTILTKVYDFMRVIMKYKNYGSEIYSEFEKKITILEKKQEKYSQKVAMRSANCMYGNLVQDINHFLSTNCQPNAMLSLVIRIEDCLAYADDTKASFVSANLLKIQECVKVIEVWIANSQRFVHHTLKKYSTYYTDFVQPLECSITMTKFGLDELKCCLVQLENSFVRTSNQSYGNLNENGKLMRVFENLIQYPCTVDLQLFDAGCLKNLLKSKSSIFTILDKMEGNEFLYFTLLKAKIYEIKNRIIISREIENQIFYELDTVLNISNQIWQEEEERRRLRIVEEESLYVNKTRCKEEDEVELELREIQENFPTNVDEDFGEFVAEDTLEQIIKLSTTESKKVINVINDDDFKLLGEHFTFIMERFGKSYYYHPIDTKSQMENLDFLTPFKDRIQVFVKLFGQYKASLNELIDEKLYTTFSFAAGLQQELLNEIVINNNLGKVYNFYKDANIPEIITCTDLLDEIECRVQLQIDLYPDHATLIDIIRVIKKIRSLSTVSSVVRFNSGFQILRQKISMWNEVAHKNNHMKDLEIRVAEYVQRWTKLELQFWRNCLSQTYEKVESNAYKYWFFIYNLLHEYLEANEVDTKLTDFESVEKRFEEGKIDETTPNGKQTTEIHSVDIIKILRQFIESSNYGDFHIRMKLLKTFELYLSYIHGDGIEHRRDILVSILRNLQIYFEQFSNEIQETQNLTRTPIEKKLREFVKIESYNKDLSYFSMRNNVARVHRTLNKFLKEYEQELKKKITSVFQQKASLSKELNLDNDKGGKTLRHETKIKYYMIDVKNFVASEKLKHKYNLKNDSNAESKTDDSNLVLLAKLDKLFITSRNVSKQAILHAEYPSMIYTLDLLLTDQIETCDYLKNLEVDRSQERPKQIIQAKNILQQKRKSLSDLFKTLTTLGVSYKTGIMELSLNSDLADFKIPPFCVKNMFAISNYKTVDQTLIYLSENLDNYYAKCVFKLKQLQNIMLTPQSELGPPNIDRIKGYSADMFLLVQNQRKLLSKSMKQIHDLHYVLSNMKNLFNCAKDNEHDINELNFAALETHFICTKSSFSKIHYVIEQFKLLIKCVPETDIKNTTALETTQLLLTRSSEKYLRIVELCNNVLDVSKKNCQNMQIYDQTEFLNFAKITEFKKTKESLIVKIHKLREEFLVGNNEYLPIANSLTELLNYLDNLKNKEKPISENTNVGDTNEIVNVELENIDVELENIVHLILLAMQKLYKKYSQKEVVKENDTKNSVDNDTTSDSSDHPIQENHLKQNLYQELSSDMEILNVDNILDKISNIFVCIKYIDNVQEKRNYIAKVVSILPILEQFSLIGDYYIFQQLGAHKVSAKMLSIMLTVFIELSSKGFCVPADLMQDEEGEAKKENQKGEGFGLEDGTGDKDVSDKIENEDQLDDAKRPEDRKEDGDKKNEDCKEEKGIDMSEDFDANLQDIEKPDEDDDGDNDKSEDENELDKQMGDTEEGAEKLDDQIWGSDEEKEEPENEEDMNDEESGKGNKDEDDQHNNLDTKNETHQKEDGKDEQQDGLDATNDQNSDKEKKKQEKDIDDMRDPEVDDDQINPYHNELEEPPVPEDMDLGDNFNLDEENAKDNNDENGENPFDIDTMKENMEVEDKNDEDKNDDETNENNDNDEKKPEDDSDAESEPEVGLKRNEEDENSNKNETEDNEEEKKEESEQQTRGEIDVEKDEANNEPEIQEKEEEKTEKFEESKDKASNEENVQSIPEEKQKGSKDQVQNDEKSEIQQEKDMDAQDTGEDKDGVGQAENETADKGHQGIADTKETKSNLEQLEKESQKNKKQGKTNEERSIGDAENNKTKQLKTIDKLKDQKGDDDKDELDDDKNIEAEEYQHVKEAKKTDSSTLDNATEEQSKQIQHLEDDANNEDKEDEGDQNIDEIQDDQEVEDNVVEIPEIQSEKIDQKSEKPSKSEKTNEKCETIEKLDVEGEIVETFTVSRNDDTTAHCNKDILLDHSTSGELSATETLEFRKLYENQLTKNKIIIPEHEDYESWQTISNRMLPNARELCEQLRLILEPTKCTRLKGDYRTGRRINMKKIIPYIASQFRKDKIWLRRTKPAQRDYKITIAIDDSKSMHHNNSKNLTLQAISLVSQALTLLESGKLSIVSFGESPEIILNHTEQFDGPKLVKSLNFDQNQSRIAELLDFIRIANSEDGSSSSDNGIFENLLLVLSDGRNIYSEGEQKVKNAIKLARLQRMFLVYIIIDNPENKHSILDIRVPNFSLDRKSISMKSYLDMFPFPYYVIVRDLGQLPIVLSEAMRQWFELVNSEI